MIPGRNSSFTLRWIYRALILLLACLFLSACSATLPEATPPTQGETEQSTALPATEIPERTPTIAATATSSGPPLAVLVAPPDSSEANNLQAALAELAAAEGLDFQVLESLSADDLSPNLRLVVALPPDPGLASLAAAAPNTQFLGIELQGLEPSGNLSVIAPQGALPEQAGFLAGYLAAVVTPEWRVGTISLADDPTAIAARQGFLNGVVFFCGLCQQTYPPYNSYPMYVEIPVGAGQAEQVAAVDTLVNSAARTVYLAPGIGGDEFYTYLAQTDLNLIGSGPAPAALRGQWVASVQTDTISAIRQLWPELVAGKGGASLFPSPQLTDINPELLSPGRQRQVEEMLADLQAGFIDPGVESAVP